MDKVKTNIDISRITHPVLVYGSPEWVDEAVEKLGAIKISNETDHDDLVRPSMDDSNMYPLFAISEEYGTRGLDFRGSYHLYICGTFTSVITRLQCFARVGRFGDKCKRIQNTAYKPIDDDKMTLRAG